MTLHMGYIFTLLVFPIETLQRHYVRLFIDAIYQSGNGYKNIDQIKYQLKVKRLIDALLTKP